MKGTSAMNDISKKAQEYADSATELLCELISHKSVMSTSEGNMPYGKGCFDCLEYAAETLEKDGFKVRRFDGHAITADMGDDPQLGILCHLDVVPVDGQDWHSDPFTAQIKDGKIYGRGAIDDKGPAAAVITAMRMIRDSGVSLKKGVRLILGSNEENGSSDMEYYTSKESFPPMLFTPDGSFPVINIEKGMIRLKITGKSCEKLISLKGGSVANAVAEKAEAVISCVSEADAEKVCGGYDGIIFSVEKADNNTIRIKAAGKGAHASTPEQGKSALTALIAVLKKLGIDCLSGLSELFPYGDNEGSAMGISCRDELSGTLTLVPSTADCKEGNLSFTADCRFPVCRRSADIMETVSKKLENAGLEYEQLLTSEPHHAPDDSEMIRTLLSVYEDCTGKEGRCIAIGGGTYVHDTENGVAFGAEWSDDNNMHGADEFIGVEELTKDIEIYAEAILRLCM